MSKHNYKQIFQLYDHKGKSKSGKAKGNSFVGLSGTAG